MVDVLNSSYDSSRGEQGFDFAIRTPCTPSRWEEFEAEMTVAWEVCDCILKLNLMALPFVNLLDMNEI